MKYKGVVLLVSLFALMSLSAAWAEDRIIWTKNLRFQAEQGYVTYNDNFYGSGWMQRVTIFWHLPTNKLWWQGIAFQGGLQHYSSQKIFRADVTITDWTVMPAGSELEDNYLFGGLAYFLPDSPSTAYVGTRFGYHYNSARRLYTVINGDTGERIQGYQEERFRRVGYDFFMGFKYLVVQKLNLGLSLQLGGLYQKDRYSSGTAGGVYAALGIYLER